MIYYEALKSFIEPVLDVLIWSRANVIKLIYPGNLKERRHCVIKQYYFANFCGMILNYNGTVLIQNNGILNTPVMYGGIVNLEKVVVLR